MWKQGLRTRTRFVAEVDGGVAGTVSGGPGTGIGVAAVTAMWVDPKFRRLGIGDLLLKTVLEWAKTQRYRQILLWVTEGNEKAERLYARNGFVRTGDSAEVRPGEREREMSRTL